MNKSFYILLFILLFSCNENIVLTSSSEKIYIFKNTSDGSLFGVEWNSSKSYLENNNTYAFTLPNNRSASQSYPYSVDMTSNVALLHLDGSPKSNGDSILDSSGFAHSVTLVTDDGALNKSVQGRLNGALSFDGNDYINLGNPTELDFTDFFTIEGWFYATNDSEWKVLFEKDGVSGDFSWYATRDHASDSVYFGVSTNGSNWFAGNTSDNSFELNVWTHVAIQYDGTHLRVFINGEENTTEDFPRSVSGPLFLSSSPVLVGAHNGATIQNTFHGMIDEIAIYHAVLTPSQIRKHYELQANKKLGYFVSKVFDSKSDEAKWNSIAWNTPFPIGKELPNNKEVEAFYSEGNMDMSKNVVMYHFNESTLSGAVGEIQDSSGEANQGTSVNNPIVVENGLFNNAIKFDGINQYVEGVDFDPNNGIDNNISISVWVWRDPAHRQVNDWDGIVAKWHSGQEWFIGVFNGNVSMTIANADAGTIIRNTSVPLNQGEWSHLVLTYSGTNFYGYLNGVQIISVPVNGPLNNTTTKMEVGRNRSRSAYFRGLVDEVAVFYDELTPSEIVSLYKRGANKLKFQVRSCSSKTCSGSDFVGSDSTPNTYFSELSNSGVDTALIDLNGIVNPNRYFQYRVFFESIEPINGAQLNFVEIKLK